MDPLEPFGMYSSSCLMISLISTLFMFDLPPFHVCRCRLTARLLFGGSCLLEQLGIFVGESCLVFLCGKGILDSSGCHFANSRGN